MKRTTQEIVVNKNGDVETVTPVEDLGKLTPSIVPKKEKKKYYSNEELAKHLNISLHEVIKVNADSLIFIINSNYVEVEFLLKLQSLYSFCKINRIYESDPTHHYVIILILDVVKFFADKGLTIKYFAENSYIRFFGPSPSLKTLVDFQEYIGWDFPLEISSDHGLIIKWSKRNIYP